MKTVDVGYLRYIATTRSASGDYVDTEVSFVAQSMPYALQNLDNERCYLVKKDELDEYMARKESLEKTKGTPEWYLSNRIRQLEAENANLRDINKSLGEAYSKITEKNEGLKEKVNKFYGMCDLKSENEKLKAKNGELEEKIKELGIIKSFLEVGNEKWIRQNTELKSRNRDLELENVKLKGELAQAEYELANFNGEHTVEFLYEKHEDNKHVVGWTDVSGKEYKLTFVTPESKIHA